MTRHGMTRRSFLKLPAVLPLISSGSLLRAGEHCFEYDGVVGTSLDLVVWTKDSRAANDACRTVLQEIGRLAGILNTRDSGSEISLLENSRHRDVSHDL